MLLICDRPRPSDFLPTSRLRRNENDPQQLSGRLLPCLGMGQVEVMCAWSSWGQAKPATHGGLGMWAWRQCHVETTAGPPAALSTGKARLQQHSTAQRRHPARAFETPFLSDLAKAILEAHWNCRNWVTDPSLRVHVGCFDRLKVNPLQEAFFFPPYEGNLGWLFCSVLDAWCFVVAWTEKFIC